MFSVQSSAEEENLVRCLLTTRENHDVDDDNGVDANDDDDDANENLGEVVC